MAPPNARFYPTDLKDVPVLRLFGVTEAGAHPAQGQVLDVCGAAAAALLLPLLPRLPVRAGAVTRGAAPSLTVGLLRVSLDIACRQQRVHLCPWV